MKKSDCGSKMPPSRRLLSGKPMQMLGEGGEKVVYAADREEELIDSVRCDDMQTSSAEFVP